MKRMTSWLCVLLLTMGGLMAQQNDRKTILEGVSAIDSTGLPGFIICTEPAAFPLVLGEIKGSHQAVAAATRFGKGKVIAASHPSFFSKESMDKFDTRRFARNALNWLGAGKVGVYAYEAGEDGLCSLEGMDVTILKDLDQLEDYAVIATYPDAVPEDQFPRLRQFVENGGGILATGIGWGWQQLSPTKTLRDDNGFNKLLGPMGLFVDNNISNRTGDGYVTSLEPSPLVNATAAIAFAKELEKSLRQANTTLFAAKSILPLEGNALNDELDAFLKRYMNAGAPTVQNPWRAADLGKRLAAASFIAAWQNAPLETYKAHPGAKNYPGMPAEGSPRVASKTLSIDLAIPRWHSTGLFAVAGEPVTVTIPQDMKGLRLRIGTTTCNITPHDSWARMPQVDLEIPLEQATTTVTHPFGGLIYIVVPSDQPWGQDPDPTLSGTIEVTVQNACAAAWFKIDRDSDDDWQAMLKDCPAPQVELQGNKVILTVPRNEAMSVKKPAELMAFWDHVADLCAILTDRRVDRRSCERYCSDDQICAGWLHSGYPIMIPTVTVKDLLDIDKLVKNGEWGFYHEIGHNHQNPDWTFDGTGEVTVNFFTLYVMEKFNGIKPRDGRINEKDMAPEVAAWVKNGKSFQQWKSSPFLALEMFVRLQVAYGWDAFEKLFHIYRTLPQDQRPKDDDEKRDQWVTRLSELTGENIATVFDAWNVPISQKAREACAKYPRPKDNKLFAGLD